MEEDIDDEWSEAEVLWAVGESAEHIQRCVDAHDKLLAACRWIGDIVLTGRDGGDAWCAVRNQPGAQEWFQTLKAAIDEATVNQ